MLFERRMNLSVGHRLLWVCCSLRCPTALWVYILQSKAPGRVPQANPLGLGNQEVPCPLNTMEICNITLIHAFSHDPWSRCRRPEYLTCNPHHLLRNILFIHTIQLHHLTLIHSSPSVTETHRNHILETITTSNRNPICLCRGKNTNHS